MPLTKLVIRDAKYTTDATTGQGFFHVYDPHALIQAAGYLKYKYATKSELIYFRGHTRTYDSLQPTLYRGAQNQSTQSRRESALAKALVEIRKLNSVLNSFYVESHEPLLQHYGLRTSWVDLVDNIWVALWFACHNAKSTKKGINHLHYERRIAYPNTLEYAYISLIGADLTTAKVDCPGLYIGKNTELIDLRIACPSIFLRPHSQHGLLIRGRGSRGRPTDYTSLIRGTIRVDLTDALAWLGDGKTLTTHSLFPPPYYDRGYDILLNSGFRGTTIVGEISKIGA